MDLSCLHLALQKDLASDIQNPFSSVASITRKFDNSCHNILFKALLIRAVEQEVNDLASSYILKGPVHTCIGMEVIPSVISEFLPSELKVTSNHRGHGHFLSHGGSVRELLDEIIGLGSGACYGRGGSMHVAKPSIGILGANGIVGAGAPIACGAALAAQLSGTKSMAVTYFGDGATNQGVFLESLNIASILRLPILFVCENNSIAQTTQYTSVSMTTPAEKASGFGITSFSIDSSDPLTMIKSIKSFFKAPKLLFQPLFLDINTMRHSRHFSTERLRIPDYLSPNYLEICRRKDPLPMLANYLQISPLSVDNALAGLRKQLNSFVEMRTSKLS